MKPAYPKATQLSASPNTLKTNSYYMNTVKATLITALKQPFTFSALILLKRPFKLCPKCFSSTLIMTQITNLRLLINKHS